MLESSGSFRLRSEMHPENAEVESGQLLGMTNCDSKVCWNIPLKVKSKSFQHRQTGEQLNRKLVMSFNGNVRPENFYTFVMHYAGFRYRAVVCLKASNRNDNWICGKVHLITAFVLVFILLVPNRISRRPFTEAIPASVEGHKSNQLYNGL